MSYPLTTSDVEAKDERTHLPVYGCGGKGWKLCDIGLRTSILKYPIYSMEVNNPTSTDIGGGIPSTVKNRNKRSKNAN